MTRLRQYTADALLDALAQARRSYGCGSGDLLLDTAAIILAGHQASDEVMEDAKRQLMEAQQ